jgi:hypothetical protein
MAIQWSRQELKVSVWMEGIVRFTIVRLMYVALGYGCDTSGLRKPPGT